MYRTSCIFKLYGINKCRKIRMALSIGLYIPHSIRMLAELLKICLVCIDIYRKYRTSSFYLASRYNKLRFKPYNFTIVDDMYPGFVLRFL